MWKRDEPARSEPSAAASSSSARPPRSTTGGAANSGPANIGRSVVVKGELRGSEDLTIEGQVDGRIELADHVLTIGSQARISAEISARSVVVQGRVTGNVTASDKIDIREHGVIEGDIVAPKVAIADGAQFKGSIDMQPGSRVPTARPGEGSPDRTGTGRPAASSEPVGAGSADAARAR